MLRKDVLTRLCEARDSLRAGCGTPGSIRQVARQAGLSRYHFIRLFKAVFGETPNQCQMKARLERARDLLLLTDRSVTDVCMEVGYSSLGTFSGLFSHRVGMTPSQYRERARVMVSERDQLPAALAAGCFALMCGPPTKDRNFREAADSGTR